MSQSYVEKPDSTVQDADSSQNDHAQPSGWMQKVTEDSVTSDQDLAYGQPVIVAVRWLMIISGLVLAIWNVGDNLQELRLSLIAIFLLALTNFYLQAQLLMKKPVIKPVVYASSAVDLILISLSGGQPGRI
jgi:hypothetical protein